MTLILLVQMSQDTEKWPDFNPSPNRNSGGGVGKATVTTKPSDPYLMEETDSGMFTLRKKKEQQQRMALNGGSPTPVMWLY